MENEILLQTFSQHPFAILGGIALILFVFYMGLAILWNGWPKFKK